MKNYHGFLAELPGKGFDLGNKDLDTGMPTSPGEYARTDRTYALWVEALSKDNFQSTSASMQKNILSFYSDPSKILEPKEKKRKKLMEQLALLRGKNPEPSPYR